MGVFETLLVVAGRPVELAAHLARLEASLTELFPDRSPPALGDEIRGRARGVDLGSVRATAAPAHGDRFDVRVATREIDRELASPSGAFPHGGNKAPAPGVSLHSLLLAGGLGAHKWADRRLLDDAQSRLPDDALPLLVDADSMVLEAARANIFAVRDGALLTPPTDGRILPGVTRMRVLEIAAALEIDVREAELSREDLLAADEVFLTGSVRGVERAGSLDGAELATGGVVASSLVAELRRTWLGVPVG
jgi:para-aminobenzoate synthetase / 4-amino-4-deoxychorismate lyase